MSSTVSTMLSPSSGGGSGDSNLVLLTQSEYDNLPDTKLSDGIAYGILDYDDSHQVKIPTKSTTVGYNGKPQTAFGNVEMFKLDITGDDMYQTEVGQYSTTFTPKTGYIWADGTTTAKTYSWNINKGQGFINLSEYDLTAHTLNNENSTYTIEVESASSPNFTCTSADPHIAIGYNQGGAKVVIQSQGSVGSTSITVTVPETSNYLDASATITAVTTQSNWTFTVKLDTDNSSPTAWGTYYDDAAGLDPGLGIFDEVFGYYPCILKDGEEVGKLDRNDFSKYEDGTPAPITELGYDVMICFPRRGIKISWEESVLVVSLTTIDNMSGYSYLAHTYKGENCDKIYISAYSAYRDSTTSKLYSTSGVNTYVNASISALRSYAHARGSNYELFTIYLLTYIQCLYTIKYCGQNCKETIGYGCTDSYSSGSPSTLAGVTNACGMNFGDANNQHVKVKLFGLEDVWWYNGTIIDGYLYYKYSTDCRWYIVKDNGYCANTPDTNYTQIYSGTSDAAATGKYLKTPVGDNISGFTPSHTATVGGTASTYFCNHTYVYMSNSYSYLYLFIGYISYYDSTGTGNNRRLFGLYSGGSYAYDTQTSSSSRLTYFHVAS